MCTYIHKVFSVVHLKGNVFALYQQGHSSYVDSCMFVWKVVKSLSVNKLLNIKQKEKWEMLPLIKPQQFLRKTGQSLLHCHFLSPVVFLCIWRIKQTHYILRAIQLIPFEIPHRYVKYIIVRKGRTNLCSDPLWTGGTTLYKVNPWQFNVLNKLPFTFKSLSRSSVIDRKPGFN